MSEVGDKEQSKKQPGGRTVFGMLLMAGRMRSFRTVGKEKALAACVEVSLDASLVS